MTAIEYYIKWAKVEAFAEIKASTVVKFIKTNIIVRFDVPKAIVTDNRPQFVSQELQGMCDRYGINSITPRHIIHKETDKLKLPIKL